MVDSLDQIGKDIVQLSPQALAMLDASNAALNVTATGNNPTRVLTLDDMVLIGYPDPNDPNVAILAEGISQARETGQLKGPITEAFLKGGNAHTNLACLTCCQVTLHHSSPQPKQRRLCWIDCMVFRTQKRPT